MGEFKAEVPEDGHAEPPKAQSPRKRSFWLELSGSAVLETRSVFFLISKYFKWVCLKIGYIPSYSHLIGIMIINH